MHRCALVWKDDDGDPQFLYNGPRDEMYMTTQMREMIDNEGGADKGPWSQKEKRGYVRMHARTLLLPLFLFLLRT